jgi:hypothetical protein
LWNLFFHMNWNLFFSYEFLQKLFESQLLGKCTFSLALLVCKVLKKLKTFRCDVQDYFNKFRGSLYTRQRISVSWTVGLTVLQLGNVRIAIFATCMSGSGCEQRWLQDSETTQGLASSVGSRAPDSGGQLTSCMVRRGRRLTFRPAGGWTRLRREMVTFAIASHSDSLCTVPGKASTNGESREGTLECWLFCNMRSGGQKSCWRLGPLNY